MSWTQFGFYITQVDDGRLTAENADPFANLDLVITKNKWWGCSPHDAISSNEERSTWQPLLANPPGW